VLIRSTNHDFLSFGPGALGGGLSSRNSALRSFLLERCGGGAYAGRLPVTKPSGPRLSRLLKGAIGRGNRLVASSRANQIRWIFGRELNPRYRERKSGRSKSLRDGWQTKISLNPHPVSRADYRERNPEGVR
jgi:hypothetical protein